MLYIRIITINFLLCLLSSVGIYLFFNYPLSLLLTHFSLLFCAFSIAVVFSMLMGLGCPGSLRRFLQPLLFSALSVVMLFLYLSNLVSNYYWKANINLNLSRRILGHYYTLYPLTTVLACSAIILLVFALIFFAYKKIYETNSVPLKRPFRDVTFVVLIALVVVVKLYGVIPSLSREALKQYYYGEMVFDFFGEYTDSHNNYLADADQKVDRVSQSVSYVEQRNETIQLSQKNIVVIVVDCLRADHLKRYGYGRDTMPFTDQMAEVHGGVGVVNFYSICNESKCGIRSILTSRDFDNQNSKQALADSLHGQLKDDGYQINFLLSSDHAFGGLKRVYYPYDFYLDGMGFQNYAFNDDRGVISSLEGWPDYNGSPNYFHFHLFSAHDHSVRYGRYLDRAVSGIKPGFLVDNPITARYSKPDKTHSQDYNYSSKQRTIDDQDNKIFQSDLVISRIMDLLKEKGYMDNALVVMTGDHGQGLGEHGYYGHIKGLYTEDLKIPLLMFDTATNAVVNLDETTFGSQLDIAPTILKHLNKTAPNSWQGRPLQFKKIKPEVTRHVIPDRSNSFAKIFYNPEDNSLYKYMFLSSLRGMKEERFFFNLLNDPKEELNLLEEADGQYYLGIIEKWGLDSYNE